MEAVNFFKASLLGIAGIAPVITTVLISVMRCFRQEELDSIEKECQRASIKEETDAEIEARFAKLREARAKKTNAHGEKTY